MGQINIETIKIKLENILLHIDKIIEFTDKIKLHSSLLKNYINELETDPNLNSPNDIELEEFYYPSPKIYNNDLNVLSNQNLYREIDLYYNLIDLTNILNESIENLNEKSKLLFVNKFDIIDKIELQNNTQYKITNPIKNIKSSPIINLNYIMIDEMNFNLNNSDKNILSSIALNIFNKIFNLYELKIEKESFKEFIHQVSLYYHDNPFHNFKHAISVLQFTYLLIKKTNAIEFMSKYELFGIFISSLVHDIDHPGHMNNYEINSKSHLALKYNDKSILENHHCSLAFSIMNSKNIQLFKNFTLSEYKMIREIIIESILSTDIFYHSNLIIELETKFKYDYILDSDNKTNWNKFNDKILFSKIITHVSDLSNQLRPFDILFEGSLNIRKEFQNQLEKETKLNLPSEDYMIIDNTDKSFYLAELGFAKNIVKPMWDILIKMFPNLIDMKNNLDSNIEKWQYLISII